VVNSLSNTLSPSGYLFIGFSESLNNLKIPLESMGGSVYEHKKRGSEPVAPGEVKVPQEKRNVYEIKSGLQTENARILRVLCVDDSPSILAILKKILSKGSGFEVVGTAGNGREAEKMVRELKPDLITLDIHMPEMTGIEYLEKNNHKGHPPVVMVTSVSRDDETLAARAISLGAMDFVEKPSLVDIEKKSAEIRTKLKNAWAYREIGGRASSIDVSFKRQISINAPEQKIRILIAPMASRTGVVASLKEFGGQQPPTFLLFDVQEGLVAALSERLRSESGKRLDPICTIPNLSVDGYYAGGISLLSKLKHVFSLRPTSIAIFGSPEYDAVKEALNWPKAQGLLEDSGDLSKASEIRSNVTDIVPATSFAYMSTEFLAKFK